MILLWTKASPSIWIDGGVRHTAPQTEKCQKWRKKNKHSMPNASNTVLAHANNSGKEHQNKLVLSVINEPKNYIKGYICGRRCRRWRDRRQKRHISQITKIPSAKSIRLRISVGKKQLTSFEWQWGTKKFIKSKLLASEDMDPKIKQDHQTLMPRLRPDASPRPIVVNLFEFTTKELIVRKAWKKRQIHVAEWIIFNQDYASEMVKKHKEYNAIKCIGLTLNEGPISFSDPDGSLIKIILGFRCGLCDYFNISGRKESMSLFLSTTIL